MITHAVTDVTTWVAMIVVTISNLTVLTEPRPLPFYRMILTYGGLTLGAAWFAIQFYRLVIA